MHRSREKRYQEETGWYEMYIEKQVEANGAVYDLVLSMDLEQLYRQIVEPVKIGKGGYSIVGRPGYLYYHASCKKARLVWRH